MISKTLQLCIEFISDWGLQTSIQNFWIPYLQLQNKKVLLQIEDDKPQVFAPKLLKWDEITIPKAIELEDAQHASIDKFRQMNDI